MRPRVCQLLAAAALLLCAGGAPQAALAQAERGMAAPDAAQPRDNAEPSPQGPPQPAPEGQPRAGPDESELQHGCPDQRRPLQLLV